MYLDEFVFTSEGVEFSALSNFKIKENRVCNFQIESLVALDWIYPNKSITHIIRKIKPSLIETALLVAHKKGYDRAQEVLKELLNE